MSKYQVVAECAFATVDTVQGRFQTLLYKGALVPGDAPELERLIDSGHVAKVDDEVTGGLNADGVPDGGLDGSVPEGITTTPVAKSEEQRLAEAEETEQQKAAAELEEKRAAARQKLTEMGGTPDGRSSEAVLVEYLVLNGYDRAEVEKANRTELKDLASSVKK